MFYVIHTSEVAKVVIPTLVREFETFLEVEKYLCDKLNNSEKLKEYRIIKGTEVKLKITATIVSIGIDDR